MAEVFLLATELFLNFMLMLNLPIGVMRMQLDITDEGYETERVWVPFFY